MVQRREDTERNRVEITHPKGNLSAVSANVAVRPLDRRTRVGRRVMEMKEQIMADLGGERYLSEMQKMMAEQMAGLQVLINDEMTRYLEHGEVSGFYLPALNTFNRLSRTLGLERQERGVNEPMDLESYLGKRRQ
ncbi:hypothetical protein QWY84_11085 [Aquisalimonas lutea]|uniref:hypothetical protein n=1 Tax=Aquisalimonas lutea TaxID=1327750 RepID=UPI0025B3E60A|nr:hypothetical protein [Aquisalimonas lutea]MDN3518155.1 hypothetical protein [Aquisalimonas lutea]